MSDEAYEEARKRLVDYFFDDKDVGEAISTMRGWGASFDARAPSFVERFLVAGFERRQMDWAAAARLFRAMPEVCSAASLVAGARLVLDNLEDHMCDLPKADAHLAAMLAGPVADGAVEYAAVAEAAKLAGPDGEEGYCVAEGVALPLMCKILVAVADVAGPARAEAAFARSGVDLAEFIGELDREDGVDVAAAMEKHGLNAIPLTGAMASTAEALEALVNGAASPSEVQATLERSVPVAVRRSEEYAAAVVGAALRVAIPGIRRRRTSRRPSPRWSRSRRFSGAPSRGPPRTSERTRRAARTRRGGLGRRGTRGNARRSSRRSASPTPRATPRAS